MALTEAGEVHTMGRCEYGRLGMGDVKNDVIVPTPVPGLKEKGIAVSAGECVSLVVTDTGMLW